MAEAIGLASSIIAIGAAATTALKVSRSMRQVARTIEAAGDEIEEFSMKIRAFASIIQFGVASLRRYATRCSSSKVMKYLEDLEVLENMALQSNRTTSKIKLAGRHTKSIQSSLTMLTRVKWYLAKPEVEALQPEMETLKTSLLVVMQSIQLEETQQGEDNEETRREIEDLKRQIKIQIETIAILQESQARRKAQSSEPWNSSRLPSANLNQSFENALVTLGQNMVKYDRVPNPREHSTSTPSTSQFPSISTRSSNTRSQRSQPSTSAATSPVTPTIVTIVEEVKGHDVHSKTAPTSPVVPAMITILEETQRPDLRQERRRISTRQARKRSRSRGEVPEEGSPTSTIESQVRNDAPVREEKSTTSKTRPTNYLQELSNTKRPILAERGNINTPNGPVSTTALIDEGLDFNLISLAHVQRLGLEMEPPNDDVPTWFTFESGERRQSCGRVVIWWRELGVRSKPFGVECLVYEHDIRDLVLGREFLRGRERARGGDGEVESEERAWDEEEV